MSKDKVHFLGCPLDCDERQDSIQEKLIACNGNIIDDPYVQVTNRLEKDLQRIPHTLVGSIDVPDWLRPIPKSTDPAQITSENFVQFIDGNHSLEYVDKVYRQVMEKILPGIPCLIGVDHSLSGGVIKGMADHYGREELTVIILDSHCDVTPMSNLAGAIYYDMENNPNSRHDPYDPLLYNRPDSYNASSFLYYLLERGVIGCSNTFIVGISDYPSKRASRIKDPRIREYVSLYTSLKSKGVKMLTKNDCSLSIKKISSLFKHIKTPYVYISFDMDVGSNNACHGVRFNNYNGLNEKQLFKLTSMIKSEILSKKKIVGLDFTEYNPRRQDSKVYDISASIIKSFFLN